MDSWSRQCTSPSDQALPAVCVKIWYEDGKNPLIFSIPSPADGIFTIRSCFKAFFTDLLHENERRDVATFGSDTMQWEIHYADTPRRVHPESILLYCMKAEGITGSRLPNCPGLDDDITRLHWRHTVQPPIPNASQDGSFLSSPSPTLSDVRLRQPLHDVNQNQPAQRPSTIRKWPTAYTAREIISGFETMRLQENQRDVRELRDVKERFEGVFPDCERFVQSTYGKHRKIWNDIVNGMGQPLGPFNLTDSISTTESWNEFIKKPHRLPCATDIGLDSDRTTSGIQTTNKELPPVPHCDLYWDGLIADLGQESDHVSSPSLDDILFQMTASNHPTYDFDLSFLASTEFEAVDNGRWDTWLPLDPTIPSPSH
ncbi:hypothetical protein V5O48_014999 [Marasmius crinis-equi]|uniref:Uncharacterized protein n=1 Tax=Marasmius crinis-equi TaxID=585013 RepID=A0ABR3EW18_9AGAR